MEPTLSSKLTQSIENLAFIDSLLLEYPLEKWPNGQEIHGYLPPSEVRRALPRFLARVDRASLFLKEDEWTHARHWLWNGYRRHDGQRFFHFEKRDMRVETFSWIAHHSPVPADLFPRAICGHPDCVHPEHLRLLTRRPRPYQKPPFSPLVVANLYGMFQEGFHLPEICDALLVAPIHAIEIIESRRRGWETTLTGSSEVKEPLTTK